MASVYTYSDYALSAERPILLNAPEARELRQIAN
jgi:hypothetical protein